MTIRRLAPVLAVALLVLAVAGLAIADTAKRCAPTARTTTKVAANTAPRPVATTAGNSAHAVPRPAAPLPPASAGMLIGIDPETGLLGLPTTEQRLQLLEEEQLMLSRSSFGLVERRLPDGSAMIDLGGRFQEFAYVRVAPGGRFVFGCANDASTLRRGLAEPVKPTVVLEDR